MLKHLLNTYFNPKNSKDKYRTILISAAFFLIFDLGVLIPNFIVSSDLKRDAVKINLAGRQRMLSQRMTKALLQVKIANLDGKDMTLPKEELALTSKLFDETLTGFDTGKKVTGSDGEKVLLEPLQGENNRKIISEAKSIWVNYQQKIKAILDFQDTVPAKVLQDTIVYADQNNLKLLDLMNQLTTEQQHITDNKANILQFIQTTGLILALTNFLILLSHSLRKLKDSDIKIKKANEQIIALNEKLQQDNNRMKHELDVTREVQQMILPKEHELAKIPGLDIAGFMQPASEVGGDYYDVIYHDGKVKIGIGDVTGHGLESGVLMIMVQTAIRTLLEHNETDPKKFLDTLNKTIYQNVQRMNSDKNMTLCLLDYENGRVRVSGQHEEMLVIRRGGLVQRVDTVDLGFPIGLDEEISDFIGYADVQLYPNDVVVLYTDGITEAENPEGELYGLKRLTEMIKENWQLSSNEIKQAVINDLYKYMGQGELLDDITLVVLKLKQLEAPNSLIEKELQAI
jgi:phosphoserine phosphatase RsbU/P